MPHIDTRHASSAQIDTQGDDDDDDDDDDDSQLSCHAGPTPSRLTHTLAVCDQPADRPSKPVPFIPHSSHLLGTDFGVKASS